MTRSSSPSYLLSISVVAYRPEPVLLERTLSTLLEALHALRKAPQPVNCERLARFYLVDNGDTDVPQAWRDRLEQAGVDFEVLRGHGNVGYGRGHNLAIERSDSVFHLVLNPDVLCQPDTLAAASELMAAYPEIGLVVPEVRDQDGSIQYLCRRYPKVLDLLLRGFAPQSIRRLFKGRLERYEMREECATAQDVWGPAIVSGCFMFYRSSVLRKLAGFDPRYFLYFEDYDLSLRTAEVARIVYSPRVRIVHFGGGAARKGWLHIRLFVASAIRFYNRFGWRWI
ncbi:glycosyl transferase [Burkholderia sp. MSh2]|uniref:Glycosyl transferase n=1 Tax=Burkholderia paludis TaxID=1506587 RepID=A0A6J5DW35_9BURK|nr:MULTISPECIES: glycosyltransferase [Burkholderia]KEZ01966.1 glycosyl transferase [Burkholderia sp. MSh2]KFG93164.1 glycosyl transferase [Burkholderia paludis]CAB3758238.1 N-acetylglucosaminyl-diphospho-decaprenol L-rhamnosyltransferase [Burkholderia paludis]VWB99112.1 glycosyl transferase [Burkholderia paludis]